MLRFKAALAAGTALCALAGAARAQTAVDELVVTGRLEESLPSELGQYGTRLEVLTAQDIERAGVPDVGQALAMLVPGLHLAPQSGPFSYNTASLQGSRPGEILYLVDGVRISNRLYNTTPPLDTVPAHMVDRIEVLDGAQGLFFGTQAVAGVVNITTRPFTDDDTAGQLSVGGDTNRRLSVAGHASGAVAGHHVVVYASRDAAKGFQPFPDADTEPSSTDRRRGYRISTAGLKYAYDFGEAARLSASYQHTEGFVDNARPTDAAMAQNTRNEEIATAKLDLRLNAMTQLFVKGYWHDWDSHYEETDNLGGGRTEVVDDHEFWGFRDRGINAVAQFSPREGLEAYLGYDLQRYGGRDDVLIIAQRTETVHAVFGQLRIGPEWLARTHLAAGVRRNMPSDGGDATVWSLSGQHDLSDQLFVRGQIGTAFRLPDAESLFANDPDNNGEIGNPNLKPERSRNLSGSVGGQRPGWSAELIGFWRETRDLISLDGETPNPDVFQFINLPGKVTAKGLEAVGRFDVSPSLSLQGSWTHAQTRPDGSRLQLAGVPRDHGQASVDLHPEGQSWGAEAIVNYVGRVVDNVSSGFGRQSRGDYAVVDLNAWLRFGPGDHHRLSARLENALGEAYATRVSRAFRDADGSAYLVHYRGVPRTFHLAYAYSF